MRHRTIALLLLASSALAGCASFSADRGMGVVSDVTERAIGKDVAFVRSADEAATVDAAVKRLLARNLTADHAVQVALLNNKGLQAAYGELALAETDLVAESLPPNPVFSISRITGNGASEVERQVVGDILALATLPARSEIARER
ncbi:TolC family protein, partial [Bradyrhizobium sp. Arg68]|nr:TolC family protein [Bradyrhizobium ivorense]